MMNVRCEIPTTRYNMFQKSTQKVNVSSFKNFGSNVNRNQSVK